MRTLATLLIAAVLTLGLVGAAWTQTTIWDEWRIYDEYGRYRGRLERSPSFDLYRTPRGNYEDDRNWYYRHDRLHREQRRPGLFKSPDRYRRW